MTLFQQYPKFEDRIIQRYRDEKLLAENRGDKKAVKYWLQEIVKLQIQNKKNRT